MRAGDLRWRVTLQTVTQSNDGRGGVTSTAATLEANVPAHVRQAPGREFLGSDQVAAERRAVFTVRYRTDLTERDRVVFEGTTYDIRGIPEQVFRQWLQIHAVAVL